jgi:hypothetical protein
MTPNDQRTKGQEGVYLQHYCRVCNKWVPCQPYHEEHAAHDVEWKV